MTEDPSSPSTSDQSKGHSASSSTDAQGSKETSNVNRLSKEEQMARYEEALKEDDWGHQPC